MAIKNIEQIKIPGYSNLALYSFNYTPGFSDSYGYIEAEFLSKTGVYPNIDLGGWLFTPITITTGDNQKNSFGNFTPVSYETTKTGQLKLLKVKFADQSLVLDRYLVALRGQVGYDRTAYDQMYPKEQKRIYGLIESSATHRIIWVGSSDEACAEAVLNELDSQDPCDPCERKVGEEAINQVNCEDYYLMNKREYNYSLTELLNELNKGYIGVSFILDAAVGDQKFDFVGSIREVLNNICSEMGLAFYYDPSSNQIKIINVRSGISINTKNLLDVDKKCKVLEETISRSKEESRDVFGVASFQKESEEREYGCGLDSCKKLKMHPFTLTDLFGFGEAAHLSKDKIIKDKPALPRRLEFYSTMTGKVRPEFRDLVMWLFDYEFKTGAALEEHANNIGKDVPMAALNGMIVRRVFCKESADPEDKFIHRLLLRLHSSKDYTSLKDASEVKKTYFFIAKVNEVEDQKIHDIEKNICENFLGKYWIRMFKQHWAGLDYSTISPDGNVNYYDFKVPINLPFAEIVKEAYGSLKASPLLQKSGSSIASGENENSLKTNDTFYLMERPAIYSPAALDPEVHKTIDKNIQDYLFQEINIPTELDGRFKKMKRLEDYDPTKYKLFVVEKEFGDAEIKISLDTGTHPEEKENVVINVNACNKKTSYGLADADSYAFTVTLKDTTFSIIMPPQAHAIGSGDQPHDGYTILVQRTGNLTPVIIPKIEIFAPGGLPLNSSANLGIEFNAYNATTNDLAYLSQVPTSQFCDMNAEQIQTLLKSLTSLMNYPIGHSEEKSYGVEGIPYNFYTVQDGIKSISISIGSSGLKTNLSFSNSFPFRVTPEQFLKKLKYMRLKQIQKKFIKGKIPEKDSNDLEEIKE